MTIKIKYGIQRYECDGSEIVLICDTEEEAKRYKLYMEATEEDRSFYIREIVHADSICLDHHWYEAGINLETKETYVQNKTQEVLSGEFIPKIGDTKSFNGVKTIFYLNGKFRNPIHALDKLIQEFKKYEEHQE